MILRQRHISPGVLSFAFVLSLSGCAGNSSEQKAPVAAPETNLAPSAAAPAADALTTPASSPAPPPVSEISTSTDAAGSGVEPSERKYKQGGDFAAGAPMTAVIGDMTVKSTVVELLKKGQSSINLKHVAEYAERATRDDLLPFQQRDASFVRSLDFSKMSLSDTDIEPIAKLNLTSLDLDSNGVKDLHAIKGMKNLQYLVLNGNPINSQGIAVVASLKQLDTLKLVGTPISDKDLVTLYDLPALKSVWLADCPNLTANGIAKFKEHFPQCHVGLQIESRTVRSGFTDLMRISSSLIRDGEFDEADLSLKGIIGRWESQMPRPYPTIAKAYRLRGMCNQKQGKGDEALRMYEKSKNIYAKQLPDDREFPSLCIEYAQLLEQMKKPRDAQQQRKAADDFWKSHPPVPSEMAAVKANQRWLAENH